MSETQDTSEFLSGPVQVEVIQAGETVRVLVAGEIDISTAPRVEARLRAAQREPWADRVVLDLRGLTFMDSTGLRLLVELVDDAQTHGYAMTIVRPPADIQRVIEISGLDQILPLVDDRKEIAPS